MRKCDTNNLYTVILFIYYYTSIYIYIYMIMMVDMKSGQNGGKICNIMNNSTVRF